MRLVPIVDHCTRGTIRYTVEEAAKMLAQAHREGRSWDCRVANPSDSGYRIMRPDEAEILTAAIAAELQKEEQ